jgi:hypothetical protein
MAMVIVGAVNGGEELGVDARNRERTEQDHQHHEQIGGVGMTHKGCDQTTPLPRMPPPGRPAAAHSTRSPTFDLVVPVKPVPQLYRLERPFEWACGPLRLQRLRSAG